MRQNPRSNLTKSFGTRRFELMGYGWPDCRCPQTHKEDLTRECRITCAFVGSGYRWRCDPCERLGRRSHDRASWRLRRLCACSRPILRLCQSHAAGQNQGPHDTQVSLRLCACTDLQHVWLQLLSSQPARQDQGRLLQEVFV
jgi:hypothetical protein